MKFLLTLLLSLACMDGFLLNQSMQAFSSLASAQEATQTVTSNQLPRPPKGSIRDTAQLITVRVFSVNRQEWENSGLGTIDISGSGILLDRKEVKQNQHSVYFYLVLTNDHVLPRSPSGGAYIKTHDGLIHNAFLHPNATFGQTDLGLLWFYSPYRYEKAVLGQSFNRSRNGDRVFVAGFPCELTSTEMSCPAKFTLTEGKAFFIDKPLVDGYQIGYKNDTREGMSGGAVLDIQGKVIGINGRGKTTAEAPQNRYADASGIPQIIRKNSPLALGIPIESYLKLAPQNSFDNLLPPLREAILFQPTQKQSYSLNNSGVNRFLLGICLLINLAALAFIFCYLFSIVKSIKKDLKVIFELNLMNEESLKSIKESQISMSPFNATNQTQFTSDTSSSNTITHRKPTNNYQSKRED